MLDILCKLSARQTFHLKYQVVLFFRENTAWDFCQANYSDGMLIYTLQPLYNTVCYNTVLDIIQFKDGSQKCIDYIEK